MPSPTLVIGVGGTGLRVLLRTKERFIEAYDDMPKEVMLLELDTDPYQGDTRESFNGVQLAVQGDVIEGRQVMSDESEFYWVFTQNNDQKIDSILKKEDPEWQWVDRIRMNRTITQPNAETITSGARTVRPIGRAALFMDYKNVYQILNNRINRLIDMIQTGPQSGNNENKSSQPDNKGQIFVTASVAGGSGAGMVLDILRMIEHIRKSIGNLPVTVSCLLVGGSCFVRENDGQRTLSNTFAALRELDRFGAISGKMIVKAVPSVIVAPSPVGRFQSTIGPADNIYLFDRPDRYGRTRNIDQYGDIFLNTVITPSIADFITGMTDTQFTPKFKSLDADLAENLKKGPNGEKGHFPYMSAGIHTLIFPERDIRWSAGFKLLNSIWNDYLVRSVEQEKHHKEGSDLAPVSPNLWGLEEQGIKVSQLTPYLFAQYGFQRDPVCGKAANNSFITTVVRSAINKEITLPPKHPNLFSYFTKGRTNIARVWALVGIPSTSKATYEKLAEYGERVDGWFDKKIEQLENTNGKSDVDRWRLANWGPGPVGNEELDQGEWLKYLDRDEIIRGHKQDFASVIISVVEELLNDKDENGRILPYRLEYAHRVMDRLSQFLDVWLLSKEGKNSRSLLSEYFDSDLQKETDKRRKLIEIDPAKDFNKYKAAMIEYARARREVFAKELLDLLCKDLKNVVARLCVELDEWRIFLRQSGREIRKRQDEHQTNRENKCKLPIRTYITDDTYEDELFGRYKDAATDIFRKVIYWTRDGEGGLYLRDAVFSKPLPSIPDNPTPEQIEQIKKQTILTPVETANRAIRWACTRYGNPDRTDEAARPPLRKMASPAEVDMTSRIADHFGRGNAQTLVTALTHETQIASLCPIRTWPASRLIYACCLPRFSPDADSATFYSDVFQGINNKTSQHYNDRKIIHEKAENPRHAFALELAAGFRLQDREDYKMYLDTYLTDSSNMYALHCFPEETTASSFFEQTINAASNPGESLELYDGLEIPPKMQLDPVVVDILRDRTRLELFVKARALGLIDNGDNGDLYLYPKVPNGNYRLSKMSENEDKHHIMSDLVFDVGRLAKLLETPQIANRMKLFYALRTFVLLQRDLENENRQIDYARLQTEISKKEKSIPETDLRAQYDRLFKNYKSFYAEYGENKADNLIILAHLGLVLSKIAFDCRNNVNGGLTQEV